MTLFRGQTENAGHFLQVTAMAIGHKVITILLRSLCGRDRGVRVGFGVRRLALVAGSLFLQQPCGTAIAGVDVPIQSVGLSTDAARFSSLKQDTARAPDQQDQRIRAWGRVQA